MKIALRGFAAGLAGVAVFAFTLPCTRLAVRELDPVFVAAARAALAGGCAAAYLLVRRARRPAARTLAALGVVALGVVIGFPLFTSLAMRSVSAGHGAIVVALLPFASALWATVLGRERPSVGFWMCAAAGSALVAIDALEGGEGGLGAADLALVLAVLAGGLGYALGGALSRSLGGAEVISWALVLALPVTLPATFGSALWLTPTVSHASLTAWLALGYVSVFSMFLGFFWWYHGLAVGGVARVGQLQLLQPFLTVLAAALVLDEPIRGDTLGFAVAVIAVVAIGQRFQVTRTARPSSPLPAPARPL